MKHWLSLLGLMWALSGCVPTVLGSTAGYPYDLDAFPTFTSPVGQPLYGQRQYNQQRWRAVSRPRNNGFEFSFSIEIGTPNSSDVRNIFGDPFELCRSSGGVERRPAQGLSVVLLEAPAGWAVGLERANYVLQCGELSQATNGERALGFQTSLELIYRFNVPATLPAGTYPVRWQIVEGARVVASEERRFVLSPR